jgi:hypothetical protein
MNGTSGARLPRARRSFPTIMGLTTAASCDRGRAPLSTVSRGSSMGKMQSYTAPALLTAVVPETVEVLRIA